jgi:hypothetical protein
MRPYKLAHNADAETLVAATLLLIGAHTLRLARRHWQGLAVVAVGVRARHRAHAGVLMGLLHGGAGSAAVIALLPLAAFDSGIASGLYLASFSLGVGAGACGFSRLLVKCFAFADRASNGIRASLRALVGGLAIAAGVLLLLELAHGGT